jgi:hypothetical protein
MHILHGRQPILIDRWYLTCHADVPMGSTGWITHFGEAMANTSAQDLASGLRDVLQFANGTGSVNLYMAHGGSNWGFWAGPPSFLCFCSVANLNFFKCVELLQDSPCVRSWATRLLLLVSLVPI